MAGLGGRRRDVFVCVQFSARTAADAERELAGILRELNTDYVDVLTFYYVETTGVGSAHGRSFHGEGR